MFLKYSIFIGFLLVMAQNNTLLAQDTWKISEAKVKFTARNAGLNVNGSFGGLTGKIKFSDRKLETSKISAKIKATTVNTGISARDRHLRKDDYFDVEKYPYIEMQSVKFEQTKGQNFKGTFNLKIKGKTQKITFLFTFVQNGSSATFEGEFKINRRDFGVGGWSVVLGNEIRVKIKVSAKKS